MIVRTLDEISGGPRDVSGPTWRSRRLLLADDGMGFSFHVTLIHAGTVTTMRYSHHLESVYCVRGTGSVENLASGEVHRIVPGTVYALDAHDHHRLRADTELELMCVFSPALTGAETHDATGAYPPPAPSSRLAAKGYATRCATARVVPRREPVLHGGLGAPGPLSPEALADYALRGYVLQRRLFSHDEVSLLRAQFARVGNELATDDARLVREPDSTALRSIFAFHELGGVAAELARDARLVYVARQILGDEVALHQSRVNRKPAFDGREFDWHSDFETWHAEDGMPSMRALSAVIFLTRHDATNGALMVVPGSHRTFIGCVGETPPSHHEVSLRRQEVGIPDRDNLSALASDLGIDVLTGEPGDALFFDCNLLHASPGNLSPWSRETAFLVYDALANRPRVRSPGSVPRPRHVASSGDEAPVVAREGRLFERA